MSDDALLSTPTPDNRDDGHAQAPAPWQHGHAQGANHFAPGEDHHHYQRWREDHARQLDHEYQEWRRREPNGDFKAWCEARNKVPVAPRGESNLETYGRAISSVVLGTQEPDLERLQQREGGGESEQRSRTDRFFERS